MTLYEHLHQQHEDLPSWLDRFNPGDPFPREQFFASRVVYYPGSGIALLYCIKDSLADIGVAY